MPEQTVNDAPGQPAGRVGSVGPGRRVQETPHADVDGIRAGVRQECTEQGVLENVEDPAIIMAAPGGDQAAPPPARTGRRKGLTAVA